jgi:hypothetical protein
MLLLGIVLPLMPVAAAAGGSTAAADDVVPPMRKDPNPTLNPPRYLLGSRADVILPPLLAAAGATGAA